MRFRLEPLDDHRTRLRFTHVGLGTLECVGVCTSGWSFFLGTSLREYLERGAGRPYRDERGG